MTNWKKIYAALNAIPEDTKAIGAEGCEVHVNGCSCEKWEALHISVEGLGRACFRIVLPRFINTEISPREGFQQVLDYVEQKGGNE